MLIEPFRADELQFAYCYRVYLRWRTYRGKPLPVLADLALPVIQEIGTRYDLHVLESTCSDIEVLLLVSLRPEEAVAACASKLKGQVSKWLREKLQLSAPAKLVSSGYFASTTGNSSADAVEHYLRQQSGHHGYEHRPRPPVYVQSYDLSPEDAERMKTKHAVTELRYHVVLATAHRRGVFGDHSGKAVAIRWRDMLHEKRAALQKVSFLPDHVHLALRAHPVISPAELILELMNSAQELMWDTFSNAVIQAGVDRLWQPSAYLGSFGDLESRKMASYVKRSSGGGSRRGERGENKEGPRL